MACLWDTTRRYLCQKVCMYAFSLMLHSYFRWLVLLALIVAIVKSAIGLARGHRFTATDNAVRHWTATTGHIQLLIGMLVYVQSPVVAYFWANKKEALRNPDALFFGALHILMMFAAVIFMTIASSKSKREPDHTAKFRIMLIYFTIALIVIAAAIPWPFSPLAQRPYWR